MSNHTLALLQSSLGSSNLELAHKQLQTAKQNSNFVTELMLITDDQANNTPIRQSALIILKNMVYDHVTRGEQINSNDVAIIKGSILDMLARQWGNKALTLLIREIIHLLAELDYPDRWPQIVPAIVANITQAGDFNTVASSVEALKAIMSVCGRSLSHEVTLSNLCNKTLIPLLQLTGKLFANYTPETQTILVSVFKIYNLAVFYHMPNIIINHIQNLMAFCKKLLDLQAEGMEPLKISCLRILSRIYSRHTGHQVGYKLLKFSQEFHERYSVLMSETFVGLIKDPNNSLEIVNLSLNCLTCIYKTHEKSAQAIDRHYHKILQLCLLRYRLDPKSMLSQSVGSFITHLKQQRTQLSDFIAQLFKTNQKLLGQLIDYLNQGDQGIQQVIFYLFVSLSEQVAQYPHLHASMSEFVVAYILPVLSGRSSTVMKARGCEIIAAYKYVQLPAEHLQSVFQFIYGCLTQSKDTYLRVYAIEAFTQLICKYDNFMKIIIPYLKDILKVYTSLMKQSNGQVYEIIKSFQLFLGSLSGADLAQCAIDLIKFLAQLFYQYADNKSPVQQPQNQSDNDDIDEGQQQQNPCSARQGCLACIREIMSADGLPQQIYPIVIGEIIVPLAVDILSDKDLLHYEQCLNVLNLSLYHSQGVPANFDQFFKIFTYAMIGLPQGLGSLNLSPQYQQILKNVCIDPDEDLIPNAIGFLRNFIAKATSQLRNFTDELNTNFLSYIFQIVSHTISNPSTKKSDRSLILTLYISLLEYQFLQSAELTLLLTNTLTWYSASQPVPESLLHLQILLIALYYSHEQTRQSVNTEWLIRELLSREAQFKYEYQLQRYILGVGRMLERQAVGEEGLARGLVRGLVDVVRRLGYERVRQAQAGQEQGRGVEADLEEEAEEDLIAENTHVGVFPQSAGNKPHPEEPAQAEEDEYDEEYNKFYYSPLLAINQIGYLGDVLASSPYIALLSSEERQQLSQYIQNVPPKVALI